MAINYTTKYSPLISKRFTQQSFTDRWAGKKFDFDGAQSVVVYTVDKAQLGDYDREAATDRFGPLSELGDTRQVMTLTQDKAFTFSIDHGSNADQVNVKHCNEQLKSNWDEVCTPAIDKYRFAKWVSGAGVVKTGSALTRENVVEQILLASGELSNRLVPRAGRVIFVSETVYIATKLASEVVAIDSLGREAVANGTVGRLDGMDIVAIPDTYLPAGVQFVIKHRDATADPMKLKTMRVQKNPVGIDGDVGECRFYHDAFVLDAKTDGIFVYTTAGVAPVTVNGQSGGEILSPVTLATSTSGSTLHYTTDGSNPKTSPTAAQYSSPFSAYGGTVIRACAKKAGLTASGITTVTVG
ncbi:MAG: chitobiase/beta-hexosaminidase C-terminal domain-containing protein [Oscillospiraceae bacterium]|jgi:hypothetical protein|nr:chitobiase/beta-hexosaminidase C-terminal domain-containing protein [Oscillospiraceae bacterium]